MPVRWYWLWLYHLMGGPQKSRPGQKEEKPPVLQGLPQGSPKSIQNLPAPAAFRGPHLPEAQREQGCGGIAHRRQGSRQTVILPDPEGIDPGGQEQSQDGHIVVNFKGSLGVLRRTG